MADEIKSELEKVPAVMTIAQKWAEVRSKDPSSKVGAAVFNPETGSIHLGYNGFPSGFPDLPEYWNNRKPENGPTKYELVVHAEMNAIQKAWIAGEDTSQCVLICTHVPCQNCMRDVVARSGIKTVWYETYEYKSNDERAEMIRNLIAKELGISIKKLPEGAAQ